MGSAELFVSALALVQICTGSNRNVYFDTAPKFESNTRDGTNDLDGCDGSCECVEDATRVHGEVIARPSPSTWALLADCSSAPFGSSCAGQARAPPEIVKTP